MQFSVETIRFLDYLRTIMATANGPLVFTATSRVVAWPLPIGEIGCVLG
jgi:hypothetical protein